MAFNFSYAVKQLLTQFHNSIKELNSVVPTKGDVNPQGFVAVGTAGTGGRDTAAYLSVDIDLSPVCHSVTEGVFRDSTPNTLMESTFKKIIQYGQDNFAMVGHTSKDPTNCETRDNDILVSVKTQRCGTVESSHYGQATSTDEDGNPIAYKDEFGMSLAEARPGRGRGLIITGRVKETQYSCPATSSPPTYEDGFIMKLKKNFELKYFQRFDYDTDVRVNDKSMTLHHFSSFLPPPHFFTYLFQLFPLPQISLILVWQ